MGMTSSALYRYFASHERLLSELMTDGFASLADALEAAEAAIPVDLGAAEQWLAVAAAHRRWALDHSTEYALIFGKSLADTKMNPDVKEQHGRGVAVLFRVMLAGLSTGALNPSALPALRPSLEAQLADWQAQLALPLTPVALAGCLFAWSQLHGAVSLELFGQLPPMLLPADALFEQHMRATLKVLGCATA
jgi:AcrR family transcriptional regulator